MQVIVFAHWFVWYEFPWFGRGFHLIRGLSAGIFSMDIGYGRLDLRYSFRLMEL